MIPETAEKIQIETDDSNEVEVYQLHPEDNEYIVTTDDRNFEIAHVFEEELAVRIGEHYAEHETLPPEMKEDCLEHMRESFYVGSGEVTQFLRDTFDKQGVGRNQEGPIARELSSLYSQGGTKALDSIEFRENGEAFIPEYSIALSELEEAYEEDEFTQQEKDKINEVHSLLQRVSDNE